MDNYSTDIIGNTLTLDGTIQLLTNLSTPIDSVIVRNNIGNAPVYLYSAGGSVCFYLNAEETITIAIRNPSRVRLQGTSGQIVYWLANVLQLR